MEKTRPSWILVPVPEDMVRDVMEAVLRRKEVTGGEHQSQSAPTQSALMETPPPEDVYYGGWTEDELRDLLKKPTRAMGIILRALATHPDGRIDLTTLAEAAYGEGASGNQLGGALGAFTRRINGRYGKDKWPFWVELDEENDTWVYVMDPKTQDVIRRILGL